MNKTEIIRISIIALLIVALFNAFGIGGNVNIKWLLKSVTGFPLFIVILYIGKFYHTKTNSAKPT